jgi:hypothetical protein
MNLKKFDRFGRVKSCVLPLSKSLDMTRPKKKAPTSAETVASDLDDDVLETDHSLNSSNNSDNKSDSESTNSRSISEHLIFIVP